jgi:hypothetical protein
MKDYPSIPQSSGQRFEEIPNAHVFDKLDGSSMRSEWNRKRGWYKHGKRSGLLDSSNPHLVVVPRLFEETMAEPLAKIARDAKWESCVVFYEFWGKRSIAGLHFEDDPKFLSLFDVAANKQGFLGPAEFRKLFDDRVRTARYLGSVHWTRGFIDTVRSGQLEGVTFEGVVAKAGTKHDIVRAKAKTQAWIDRVMEIHGELAGRKLVES